MLRLSFKVKTQAAMIPKIGTMVRAVAAENAVTGFRILAVSF